MDACRTAVRLGAKEVSIIYRRTKDEMPADLEEIEESEEEGVIFRTLTNPIEYLAGADGRVSSILLQIMELGEPDASGRRRPVPVEGKTLTLDVDAVILATGQAVNPDGFDGLELTRKNGIVYDNETYRTSLPGVFAGGDCGNDKISIAIEAIADGEKTAALVDAYLRGEELRYVKPYVHERDDVSAKSFEDRERQCRASERVTAPSERANSFAEVCPAAFTAEEAVREASRCLECGCGDVFDCKLLKYSREYAVKPERFAGEKHEVDFKDSNRYIIRDANKCVMCGLCVRVCGDVVGAGAIGFTDRGFDAAVMPAFGRPLEESSCVSCGMCVALCPTGALQERLELAKPVPLKTKAVSSTCSRCSIGCGIRVETYGGVVVRTVPDRNGAVNGGLLCKLGRFESSERLAAVGGAEAAAKKLSAADAIAVSPTLTNEDAAIIKAFAERSGKKIFCYSNAPGALKSVYGVERSPSTFNDLADAELIVAVNFDEAETPVAGFLIRRAERNGVKSAFAGADGVEAALERAPAKTVLVYQRERVSFSEEEAIARLAKTKGFGLIRILPGANSQGLIDLGITDGSEVLSASDRVVLVGTILDDAPDGVEIIAAARRRGTFTNTEGRTQRVSGAVRDAAPTVLFLVK
jgi:formate dehydrogenase major subunit